VSRVYLDWNATAPLRPQARAAMLAAMDAVGNPSSVHSEGRVAKAIVETARAQVAALVGCEPGEVVFTSGATEGAATILRYTPWDRVACADTEHDCILRNIPADAEVEEAAALTFRVELRIDRNGLAEFGSPGDDLTAVSTANGETGIKNDLSRFVGKVGGDILCDATQLVGKGFLPWGPACGDNGGIRYLIASSHKIGGPKGVGLFAERGSDNIRFIKGGGQEMSRRASTENVIGIAGFGAACEAAGRDLENGAWDRVAEMRDDLEDRLAAAAPDLVVVGREAPRLPNTSCFAVPGWRGETQVMQMDLAGFAISAGSACSSGKTGPSRVLLAMGFDEETAASAIRVSMGPATAQAEVTAFADRWIEHYRRRKARAA